MSNILNQTYKELSIPHFREVFQTIDEIMREMKIPCYLIGVAAIDLELLEHGIKPSRGTMDIDFAIMINSLDQYDEVQTRFEAAGFNKAIAPWTYYHAGYNVAVDLLPFGEIVDGQRAKFKEKFSDFHLLGFSEVVTDIKDVRIEDSLARIPPLYAMVILKLVAWSDRPEERGNDPYDILRIIQHYFQIKYHEIVEHHNDTFPEEGNIDEWKVAARVLGRNSAELLTANEQLKQRVLSTLEQLTVRPEKSKFAILWAQQKEWTLDYATSLLSELKTGILERLT